ncbi:hypothetical protein GCM10010313_44260 [Streptomyces violarus]|uniref:Uncharacterized protein n=1 Tax=Streptomyces violarus TaxID=67380 RepID=A0A7W5F2D4_9ACTN|nr:MULTISPECIES: hypothetical protein [Streptomyces]MBB3077434.1 hypothetical protein [Streptomyces violarus]WRU00943.1 hypothetical protein VJ737_26140 [Streptomyces sp. CGMCC 4.1772]GHD16224.1 hypothetical protein GCM10010313_44260 [Streptomyces violarus]
MRLLARSALAGTAATLLALAAGASAHADGTDRTVWAGADWNVTPQADSGGKAHIGTPITIKACIGDWKGRTPQGFSARENPWHA